MTNKYESTIDALKIEVFPKIKELLVVFVYGSVSRGDFSLRHSDLDLFIVIKKRKPSESCTEKINQLMFSVGSKYGVKIHAEYQGLNIRYDDRTLVEKMIEEGKIIYSKGVFTFDYKQIGLKQFLIYEFNLKKSARKTMFSKTLHGRSSWYLKNGKKITKTYSGIIDGENIIELGKGALMVIKDKEKELKAMFNNFEVEYKLKKIVYG